MKRVVLGMVLLGILGLALGSIAAAQTPADIEAARRQAEAIQRLEQERLRMDLKRVQPGETAPEGTDTRKLVPKSEAPTAVKECHVIKEIVITGAKHLPESVQKEIRARFLNQCLGVPEIETILGEITKAYIIRGYVTTRAYLPSQDLSSGRLEITVIEGKVQSIRIEDGNKASVSKGNAFPLVEGRVLNLRDLEQGIDQINRLASNNAKLDIQPGDNPGESVIIIRNERLSPFHFNAGYDNQGTKSTGQYQAGVAASVDNPLGFADLVSATYSRSVPGERMWKCSESSSLNYSIPFGYTTAFLGISHSEYASQLSLPSGLDARSSGNSTIAYGKLDRVVYRDQATRASLSGTLTYKNTSNYLDELFLDVSSRKLAIFDLDATVMRRIGTSTLQFNIGLTQGLKALGAKEDEAVLSEDSPRAQFRKYKIGFYYQQPFRCFQQDLSFSSQFAGQYAKDVLYGSEQMLIGSIYTVRGFEDSTLSGDHGYYWRNELALNMPVRVSGQTLASRFFVAYDVGAAYSRVQGNPEGTLTGAACGFSVAWAGVMYEMFFAHPITAPSVINRESPQTWFRVSYAI